MCIQNIMYVSIFEFIIDKSSTQILINLKSKLNTLEKLILNYNSYVFNVIFLEVCD